MIKHHAFTPARYHLGDLINIIQQCVKMKKAILGSTHTCNCCGNDVYDSIVQLLSLLQSNTIAIKENLHPSQTICPSWSRKSFGLPPIKNPDYNKSFMAIDQSSKTSDFFTYQFDARSNAKMKSIDQSEKSRLLESGLNFVDVGEGQSNIIKKFDLINRSVAYIGIDSGMTHLALMTNTPIYLIHPKAYDPLLFYPTTTQISAYHQMEDIVKCLQT